MRKFMPVFLALFMVLPAAATNIESEEVMVDLKDSDVHVTIEVGELTSSNFTYLTSYPVQGVKGWIDGRETSCSAESLQIGSEIRCHTSKKNNFTVRLEFSGQGFVESRNDISFFRYTQSFYRPTESYRLRVLLPEGTGILDQGNLSTPVVSPEEDQVGSDGRRIFVEWRRNPELGETVDFEVAYEGFSSEQDPRWMKIAVAVAGLIAVAAGIYFGYFWFTRESIEKLYEDLSGDEVEVLELIRKNDGTMLQKDVVEESDYSKAKISSLVSGLVDKDILKKKKEGRSNSLSLTRKYRV